MDDRIIITNRRKGRPCESKIEVVARALQQSKSVILVPGYTKMWVLKTISEDIVPRVIHFLPRHYDLAYLAAEITIAKVFYFQV